MTHESITYLVSQALERDPSLTAEAAVKMAHKRVKMDKREHVEHDWMEAQKKGKAVPMDARSSPFVEKRNGIEYRVADPICMKSGIEVKVPAVPSDPRHREAHQKWKLKNVITGEE